MWDGFWFLANRKNFETMNASTREIVIKTVNEAAMKQRADVEKLNGELRVDLMAKGLQFLEVDSSLFRQKLQESGFYVDWRKRFGDEAWELLESSSNKLI